MKLQQIPSVRNIIMRWRPHAGKSASDPALDAPVEDSNGHRAPPSPKSPSKKSVRIFEAGSSPQPASSTKGKGKGREASSGPAASMPQLPSPPPSPLLARRSKSADRCSSGEPVTHPELGEILKRCGPVHIHEAFECEHAVEPVRLLTLTRRRLMNEAQARGGNALVDESWGYTVSKRGRFGYTVKVDYNAGAVLVAGDGTHGPQGPVATDIAKTKGINGLMTVTSRH